MEVTRLEQEQMIERYILNQMDEEEASEFEAYFLSNQECLEQLEMAEKLHQGLTLVAAQQPVNVSGNGAPVEAANDSGWWNKALPLWSFAALAVLMLLPVTFVMQKGSDLAAPSSAIQVINVPMSLQRNAEQELVLNVNRDKKQVILSMYVDTDIESLVFAAYQFDVVSDAQSINNLTIGDLTLGDDDTLYVSLGTNYLQVGEYEFVVSGMSDKDSKTLLRRGKLRVK